MPENKNQPPPRRRVIDASGMSSGEKRAWQPESSKKGAVSGNALISSGARGTRPSPEWLVEIVRGSWAEAEPRAVQLGTMPQGLMLNSLPFPPSTPKLGGAPGAAYAAGAAVDDGSGGVDISADGWPVACVVEYGHGAAGSRAVFDWVPGVYNLPPCSYVNVSVLPWGPLFGSSWNPTLFGAAVVPGNQHNAHVPTVSSTWTIALDESLTIPKPDHARGFEVELQTDGAALALAGALNITGCCRGSRNFATGAYQPGWTPLDVNADAQSVVLYCSEAPVAGFVRVVARWYLAL